MALKLFYTRIIVLAVTHLTLTPVVSGQTPNDATFTHPTADSPQPQLGDIFNASWVSSFHTPLLNLFCDSNNTLSESDLMQRKSIVSRTVHSSNNQPGGPKWIFSTPCNFLVVLWVPSSARQYRNGRHRNTFL